MARFSWKRTPARTETQSDATSSNYGHSEIVPLPYSSRTAPDPKHPVSIFHIYHKGQFHYRLTPERDDYKDKVWPSWSETKTHRREKREQGRLAKMQPPGAETNAPGFFVHKPRLCFGHPPRTLRRGQSKQGAPICLIHNSWFWRNWQIQFCDGLDEPGVVDPRGIVGSDYGYASRRDSVQSRGHGPSGFVQGYPVRKWRLWGDSGKEYHQSVNKQRRQSEQQSSNLSKPLEVSTAVSLVWKSPFSPHTRRYNFQYQGLQFCWKGTGTVRHPGSCGAFVRFNHLKLTVELPAIDGVAFEPASKGDDAAEVGDLMTGFSGDPKTRDVVLATYTSSLASRKSGVLEVRDREVLWLLTVYLHGQCPTPESENELHDDTAGTSLGRDLGDNDHLGNSQLYYCILATAMCMIIAENQKREWVRHILELAAGEAGAAGG